MTLADFIGDMEGLKYAGVISLLEKVEETVLPDLDLRVSYEGTVKLPEGFTPIMEGDGILTDRARAYLEGRNISLDYAEELGIGYVKTPESPFFGCIIIPFFRKGRLIYFIGRNFYLCDPYLRYVNPDVAAVHGAGKGDMFFNEDALFKFRTVELMEGAIDAMTMGERGISSQGWKLSETQFSILIESPVENIIIIPDLGVDGKGIPFRKHAYKTATDLIEFKTVFVADLSPFEELGKDPNAIGAENVRKCYKGLKKVTMQSAIIEMI